MKHTTRGASPSASVWIAFFAMVSALLIAFAAFTASPAHSIPDEGTDNSQASASEPLPDVSPELGDYQVTTMSFTNGVTLSPQFVDEAGMSYFFVPSGCDMSNVKLSFAFEGYYDSLDPEYVSMEDLAKKVSSIYISGRAGDQSVSLYSPDSVNLSLVIGDAVGNATPLMVSSKLGMYTQTVTYMVIQSSSVNSMFIQSNDPEHQGMAYTSYARDNKARGNLTVYDAYGNAILDYAPYKYIKSRGNSSFWGTDKKSYNIKLEQPAELIPGEPAARSWSFISMCYDPTLTRNALTYKLAQQMGYSARPDCDYVDLYYDGVYRGTYLMTEKVEVGEGRIDIRDLEEANEKANPGADLDDEDIYYRQTGYLDTGCAFRYNANVRNPRNITGGYLLELDLLFYDDENCYFDVTTGQTFTLKSPSVASQEEVAYIAGFVQEIYDCIDNGYVNPTTGKGLFDYVDAESFAKYLYLQEFAKNVDAFTTSTFFYKPANEDKLYAGPIWDMDDAYGVDNRDAWFQTIDGWRLGGFDLAKTFLNYSPEFASRMDAIYDAEIAPVASTVFEEGGLYDQLLSQVSASAAMNDVIWDMTTLEHRGFLNYASRDQAIAMMRDWTRGRFNWLDAKIRWANVVDGGYGRHIYSLAHPPAEPFDLLAKPKEESVLDQLTPETIAEMTDSEKAEMLDRLAAAIEAQASEQSQDDGKVQQSDAERTEQLMQTLRGGTLTVITAQTQ